MPKQNPPPLDEEPKLVVPHLYLDTNILLDVFHDRRDVSVVVVENARNRKWFCSTSHFTLMEMADAEQEERYVADVLREGGRLRDAYRSLRDKKLADDVLKQMFNRMMRKFSVRYPFIRFYGLRDEGLDEAIRLCGTTNIDAPDCIHLATAKEAGCDLLVTNDDPFWRLARDIEPEYIRVAKPDKVDEELRSMGFRWS